MALVDVRDSWCEMVLPTSSRLYLECLVATDLTLFESDDVLEGFSTVMTEARLFVTSASSFSAECFESILAVSGLERQ